MGTTLSLLTEWWNRFLERTKPRAYLPFPEPPTEAPPTEDSEQVFAGTFPWWDIEHLHSRAGSWVFLDDAFYMIRLTDPLGVIWKRVA